MTQTEFHKKKNEGEKQNLNYLAITSAVSLVGSVCVDFISLSPQEAKITVSKTRRKNNRGVKNGFQKQRNPQDGH